MRETVGYSTAAPRSAPAFCHLGLNSGVPIEIVSKVILRHAKTSAPPKSTLERSAMWNRSDCLRTVTAKATRVDPMNGFYLLNIDANRI